MELGEHRQDEPPVPDCDCRRCAVATRDDLRKKAWSDKAGFRFPNRHTPPHKPRIPADDMAGAASIIPEGDDQ